ncbi:MAG: DUF389 domain-containing protein [Saprospiraceae bacterium]
MPDEKKPDEKKPIAQSTPAPNLTPTQQIKQGVDGVRREFVAFFSQLIDLKKGMDREGTIISIKNNKRMEGANAWLLMCSIMIASLGLDLNSPAVIIGAMLISPLMSPILGIGLAVGINDRKTLMIALRHLAIAIGIALFTSTLYFSLTPFGQETSEILARTKPTLLDVLVAFFGGIAGIISGSRKDKSNAIPGVAIATALMPPLCVCGFGIANMNQTIILSSFYLFFLNTTFVAVATYIIVRLLDFPFKAYIDPVERRKTRLMVIGICLLLILPSLSILSTVYQENKINNNINAFLGEYFGESVDAWGLLQTDSTSVLNIKVYGSNAIMQNMEEYQQGLVKYGIEDTKIQLIPTSEISLEKFEQLKAKVTNVDLEFSKQLDQALQAKSEKDILIERLKLRLDSLQRDSLPYFQLCMQAKTVFTDLQKIDIATNQTINAGGQKTPIVLVNWQKGKSIRSKRESEAKLYNFIKVSTKVDTLQIIRY